MNSTSGSAIASSAARSRREKASNTRRTMSAFSPTNPAPLEGQREWPVLAGELLTDLEQHVEHRLLGGRAEAVAQRRGHDLAHRRAGAERAHHDVVAHRHQSEV